MKKRFLILGLMAACLGTMQAAEPATESDSIQQPKAKASKLPRPLRWIAENWSAYDPKYSVPAFYNWAAQIQNNSTLEWLHMESPEGMDLSMRSKMSHRFGPYFGYQWLFYGMTVDLGSLGKPSKNKNEFTLTINSNLVNIDIIRRRTGGDFTIQNLEFNHSDLGRIDLTDIANDYIFGDYIKNSLTGININYFTNHKRYSNPAAFSNGAIQLRSAGSPIIGLGYTHQKVNSDVSDVFSTMAMDLMTTAAADDPKVEEIIGKIVNDDNLSDEEADKLVFEMLDVGWDYLKESPVSSNIVRSFITNRIPTVTRIDDWHLQLGYAYNLVFSRRLLLGLSAVVSPGIKRVRADNKGSMSYEYAKEISGLLQKHEGVTLPESYFKYDYDDSHFNVNAFFRASLTFNYNRWRAGLNASYSNYFYNNNGMKVNNAFGNLTAYVGYCFGRKKEYRYNGALRQDYIAAALTKSQIEEMKDSMPAGNLEKGSSYQTTHGKTRKYHSDELSLGINGCDLVRGPEGRYGWYEIEDGYVAPGEDTDERLRKGTVLEIDRYGRLICQAGHDSSIRTSMWWKSQVDADQIPSQWYPEMLHYALKGKLVLYLRGRIFGTNRPVKMEIPGFCVSHGKETQNYFQVAIQSFRSKSLNSIEGRAVANGKTCRVFIEQKGTGKEADIYVSRVHAANSDWMAKIDGQRTVSSLSMPGTHDAGTASLVKSPVLKTAHTQNFSMVEQLYDGIRAFDIRLKKDLKYGHFLNSREMFDSTMVAWDQFLTEHPSECIVALIGKDGGGAWEDELISNFRNVINRYPDRFVEQFDATTKLDDVRGKILVLRRQESCPFGKLLKFEDNTTFDYDCFRVEDVYKEHKTWKKAKIVEQNIRDAYENEDASKWYITFNSIAWSPRRHLPYSYAWGGKAKNIRKPMNKTLREFVELKDYTNFGIVFMDFYNDHGEQPQVVETIISSNFSHYDD